EIKDEKIIQQFKSDSIILHSPSGQAYHFSEKQSGNPQALMTPQQAGQKLEDAETAEEHQQRLAVTMMNMIDNVLARSNGLTVNTEDPFLSAIAELYVKHLETSKELKLVPRT